MKAFSGLLLFCVMLLTGGAPLAHAQTYEYSGYTFMRGATGGTLVCLGTWRPSRDPALPGTCDGPVVDVSQLAAVSSKMSADKLDQMLPTLQSIDQRLAENNALLVQLIQTALTAQAILERQTRQADEHLREEISSRFDAVAEEVLQSDQFREELNRLRGAILEEVEKRYTPRPTPPAK